MPTVHNIIAILKSLYPEAVCSLEWHGDPWRLLVMGRLSAQCTDERVNIVCPALFDRYPDVYAMAAGEAEEIGSYIRSCGLWRSKAESLKGAAEQIVEKHGGKVPADREALLALPGVGRKIANLVLGDAFGIPGIVADTHCIRINGRFGFYPETMKDPLKTEKLLDTVIPSEEQSAYCHRMVLFGREYCTARSPRCKECPLAGECLHGKTLQEPRPH